MANGNTQPTLLRCHNFFQDAISEESEFFKINNDDENGSEKLKTIISMELIKKIKEKVPVMESKITKNLSTLKANLNEFQFMTNEDFQVKIINSMAREFEKKFNADIGYASSAMTPEELSHGAMIFDILDKWFSQKGRIWNEQQQAEGSEESRWYLKNPEKQKEMLEAINIKQRNVRGGFNFTCPAERTMKEIIKNELDHMIELPKGAIEELVLQLRSSYKNISEVC